MSAVLSGCGAAPDEGAETVDQATGARFFYVSASSVDRLNGSLAGVTPEVKTPAFPEAYLASNSALGSYGPIGAYGPLGTLGPVGSNTWNPSTWISGAFDWSDWGVQGPLTEAGPLGPDGPLGRAYEGTLPRINDFAKQLQAGGVWTVLGPLGPLGALGPLGPHGPVGAHGHKANDDGSYAARTARVGDKVFGLVEQYTEQAAKALADNDTSFMAVGRIDGREADAFSFKSSEPQFVTVAVIPEKELDDFDLELRAADGRLLASSRSHRYIDWIQIRVPAGATLKAQVSLYSSWHLLSKTYRLIVVGSTRAFTTTDIRGPHQVSYTP